MGGERDVKPSFTLFYRERASSWLLYSYQTEVDGSNNVVQLIWVVVMTEDKERLLDVCGLTEWLNKVTKILGTIVNLNKDR